MSLEQATPEEVRSRILEVKPRNKRLGLMAQYIWATRRSEVCGQYAFHVKQLELTEHQGKPVAVFSIIGAKIEEGEEEGLEIEPRPVALPLEVKYDPWVQELVDYIQKTNWDGTPKTGKVFRYSDSTLYRAAKKAFRGLHYKIMVGRRYRMKPLATHGLRHIRVEELINRYGFEDYDIVAYAGWSPKAVNMPAILQRYASLKWRRYIEKLFVARSVSS